MLPSILALDADSIVEQDDVDFDDDDKGRAGAGAGSAASASPAPPTAAPIFGSLGRKGTFTGPWAEIPVDTMARSTLSGICEELTLRPCQMLAGSRRLGEAVVCYQLDPAPPAAPRVLRVPRAYFHERFGKPGRDDSAIGLPVQDKLAFVGALRDERQKAFVSKMVSTLIERRTTIALGSAEPGCGKTVMFLYLWAVVLRRKCLVIVHGLPIVAQWIAAVKRFCPAARVGIIHQDLWQIRDRDIVVASSDTLAARADQFTDALWKEFGVMCFDEAHHIMASTFVSIYQRCMHARFCISLTGTPYRKDGLTAAMPFLTGPNAASMKNTDPVHVRCVHFTAGLQTRIEFKFGPGKGKPNEAAMISAMVEDERRTRLIAQVVRDCVVAGRKVLVLCDRNELREAIRLLVTEMLESQPCSIPCRPWVKSAAGTAKAAEGGKDQEEEAEEDEAKDQEEKPDTAQASPAVSHKTAAILTKQRRVMDIYDRIYIEPYRATPTPGDERRAWAAKLNATKRLLGATDEECLAFLMPPRVVPDLEPGDETVASPWIEALNAGDDYLTRMNKQHARAILATYVMAREALDIPGLNSLVLATPSSDVRQAVGRIRRTGAGSAGAAAPTASAPMATILDTQHALVIDVVDAFAPFITWAMTRQRFYENERFATTKAVVHAPADRWDLATQPAAGRSSISFTAGAGRNRDHGRSERAPPDFKRRAVFADKRGR